tara:strand:+ start:1800 stop:2201 length:402 start_codon:yes stop_codon:yes gene_type:complete
MNNHKRRNFRSRPQKTGFRRRNGSSNQSQNNHLNNGNNNFTRGGNITNPFNIEKAIQRFQQLAKDAQSNGDPVMVENYLQHADHYSRKLAEINSRRQVSNVQNKEITQTTEVKLEEKSLAQILTDNSKELKKD